MRDAAEIEISRSGVSISPNLVKKFKRPGLKRLATNAAKGPDDFIVHLNKLIAPYAGLSAILSTVNYSLWLLAYLAAKSVPLQRRLRRALGQSAPNRYRTSSLSVHLEAWADLHWETRTTLRLVGLIPLYCKLRSLLRGPKAREDLIVYAANLAHGIVYSTFHLLENFALLFEKNIMPVSWLPKWTSGNVQRMYFWAYRWRTIGLFCNIARLLRVRQLEQRKRRQREAEQTAQTQAVAWAIEAEDALVDKRWWGEIGGACFFMPIALPYWLNHDMPTFNLGVMGASGLLAGLSKVKEQWLAAAR